MRRLCANASEQRLSWPKHGIVLSPVKLWVLAMLAPRRGLRVAPVPPQAANVTTPARDADGMPGRDAGTGTLIEPRNMGQPSIPVCQVGHSLDTVTCPIGGETENASHTEILTVPIRAMPLSINLQPGPSFEEARYGQPMFH